MRIYTSWAPLFLTTIIAIIYTLVPVRPPILGKDGLAAGFFTLMATLPGFYFAGLAAVATFGAPTMDQEMPAPAPEVSIIVGGSRVYVKLTRRLFLSYLFSYLVILAFSLCAALLILSSGAPSIIAIRHTVVGGAHTMLIWFIVKASSEVVLAFLLSSMAVTTLHGVFFLSEKIHQP